MCQGKQRSAVGFAINDIFFQIFTLRVKIWKKNDRNTRADAGESAHDRAML
jgi:hypothetical protein